MKSRITNQTHGEILDGLEHDKRIVLEEVHAYIHTYVHNKNNLEIFLKFCFANKEPVLPSLFRYLPIISVHIASVDFLLLSFLVKTVSHRSNRRTPKMRFPA
jgi:hypothetical protein